MNDLKNDKHLKKVNFFREIYHSTEGRMYLPDTGIKIDNESLPVRYEQPFLGEHNKEILIELGYNMKEINKIVSLNKKIDD